MVVFCDECGLANDPAASHCSACRHALVHASGNTQKSIQVSAQASTGTSAPTPIAPITITPPPVREVTPGPLFSAGGQPSLVESLLPASRPHPAGDFPPGTLLARRYKIENEIGRGGFSVVYRATDLNAHHREVAIKRIQLSALSPREVIDATETFNRELTMLARFKNVSGVPAFYEHLTDAENWYLVMQYIPGRTLEEYLHSRPGGYLDEKETVALGMGIAHLMKGLHEARPAVIFRDLKPSNIMLTSRNEFFLIDFGIARNYTPGKTKDTTPLGSPGFAPPEQYGRAQTDQRSDIYSLGATLQTLLTGRDPQDLRAGEQPRNPTLPSRAMRKLLDEMLAPTPGARPWSMSRVEMRLAEIQNRGLRLRSLALGFVQTLLVDVFLVVTILSDFHASWFMGWIFFSVMFNRNLMKKLRQKLGVLTPVRDYWLLGIALALLPVFILFFLKIFWWPF